MKKEIKLQKKLNFPHVLKFYHKFEDLNNVYFVLEYAEKGSVFNHLKKKRTITEEESFYLFIQTCLAVDYLHKEGIIHRDLKVTTIPFPNTILNQCTLFLLQKA